VPIKVEASVSKEEMIIYASLVHRFVYRKQRYKYNDKLWKSQSEIQGDMVTFNSRNPLFA
jgi:hypothetical protein